MWQGLDLILPPSCGGCGKPGARWCPQCQSQVQQLPATVCPLCGLPHPHPEICQNCSTQPPHFNALRSWAVFEGPLRLALHRLKYHQDLGLGDALAVQMLDSLRSLNWDFDMIIPVPLGQKRRRERGYNQVAMVAKPLALALGVQFSPHALVRHRETRSQVGLTYEERRHNVRGAFQARSGVSGKKILILDDVATTGSTLSASAEALHASGAKIVLAMTVARALPHHGLTQA